MIFNISASSQGAWHKRSRVWIVAANTNPRLSIGENEKIFTRGNTFDNGSSADVSDTNKFGTQIQTQREHTSIKMSGSSSKESWWEAQSDICRNVNGISYELDKDRTNRIKALGNSIVPQIAYEIGKAIIDAEDSSD